MRETMTRIAMASAFVSLAAFTAQEVDARGGARGGGATSMSRGGGGGGRSFARGGGGTRSASAGSGFSRGGSYSRPGGGASASQRPAGNANRGNLNTGNINRGNINTGNVNRGNINTGNVNTGNINRANVNTGDINVSRDIHVDNDYNGWGGWHDYPIAAGAAIGAMAVTRAAVIGAAYYSLPPSCSPYAWQTYTYYYCGSVYYRPQYEGDKIVYIVVPKPG